MPTLPPQLDERTLRQIMQQLFDAATIAFDEAADAAAAASPVPHPFPPPRWKPPQFDIEKDQAELFSKPFDDAGIMLALVFARLMEITLARLNAAPEKNLRAFLDIMGVTLLPPAPAHVPLTFMSADGVGPTLVPPGTQAGSLPKGAQPSVLFETEQALTAIPATLIRAFTVDPVWDRFTDQTAQLNGQAENSVGFTPFVGQARMPHILFVGDDYLLNFKRPVKVEITYTAPNNPAFNPTFTQALDLMKALLWQQRGVSSLTRLATETPEAPHSVDRQVRLSSRPEDLTILLVPAAIQPAASSPVPVPSQPRPAEPAVSSSRLPPGLVPSRPQPAGPAVSPSPASPVPVPLPQPLPAGPAVSPSPSSLEGTLVSIPLPQPLPAETLKGIGLEAGIESRWLYGVLPSSLSDTLSAQNVALSRLILKVTASNILPDFAFTNDVPLDTTRPFFPFGEQPRVGDVFVLGSEEAFGTPGASITLTLNNEVRAAVVPTLVWEALMPEGWLPLAPQPVTEPQDVGAPVNPIGRVMKFKLPDQPLARGKVNGQTSCWIRALIVSGDYGKPLEYEAVSGEAAKTTPFQKKAGTGNLQPPQAQNAYLELVAERAPRIVTQNGFLFTDHTQTNANALREPQPDLATSFTPFLPVQDLVPTSQADPTPAFYLAFDAAFPQEAVTLYIAATPSSGGGSVVRGWAPGSPAIPPAPPPEWEYFNGVKWNHLTVFDRTAGLTQSGTLDFLTPPDMRALARFDLVPRFWIRSRAARNDPADTPRLAVMLLNTVPAVQAVQINEESVGSGNGLPLQTLALSRTPVLPGAQIWVREMEMPSQHEGACLEEEEGADAMETRQNPQTGAEIWLRWHERPNFVLSKAHSRHYTLDHTTGVLTFGDGVRGLIPPRGTANIRANYQTGGGEQGNVSVGSVGQIAVALPGINAVTNPLPGEGGAPLETTLQVRERGPQTLRHRDRAISAADVEWLAKQAAGTRVARARCLPNINRNLRFEPGWLTLLIVPQGTQSRLVPGPQLLREVEEYLVARAPASLTGLAPSRLNVVGAGYVRVSVVASVAPHDIHATQAVRDGVLTALQRFFQPLTGGRDGQGWDFGRSVHASDVSNLLQSVPGVNHVDTLELQPNVAQNRFTLTAPLVPSQALPAGSRVEIEATANPQNGASGAVTPHRKVAILAEPLAAGASISEVLVKSFKEGDRVTVVRDFRVVGVTSAVNAPSTRLVVVPLHNTASASPTLGFPRGSLVTTFDGTRASHLALPIPVAPLPSPTSTTTPTPDAASNSMALSVQDAVFQEGDILTAFYPFSFTVRAVRKDVVTLTFVSVDRDSSGHLTGKVNVSPFDTDAAGLPKGSRVQKQEPLFESARLSILSEESKPNKSRITTITLPLDGGKDNDLVRTLQPDDVLLVHRPIVTLDVEPYWAEGDPLPIFEPDTVIAFPAGDTTQGCILSTLDNRARLPLAAGVEAGVWVSSLHLYDAADGETIRFPADNSAAAIQTVSTPNDIVYLDANYLVESGDHVITMTT